MFLLIDNFDSFTFNLVQAFQQLGKDPLVLRHDDKRLMHIVNNDPLEAVVISPGPGGPLDSGLCLPFLQQLSPQVPVLGVCLGHQVLAHLAGEKIERAARIMHGKTSQIRHSGQGIFTDLPNPFEACRYHSLIMQGHTGNSSLAVLASSEQEEIMAIAYQDRPWFGIQFHPESILTPNGPDLLDNFLKIKNMAREKEK